MIKDNVPIHKTFAGAKMTPRRLATMYQTITRKPLNVDKATKPTGQLFLIPSRCKDCEYCVTFCPNDVLEMGTEHNEKGYTFPTLKKGNEDKCVDCKSCLDACPEFAIYTKDYETAHAHDPGKVAQ